MQCKAYSKQLFMWYKTDNNNNNNKPRAAAQKVAQKKIDKYSKLASTHIFYLFAIETAGTWHQIAIELTQEIGKRISTITVPLSQYSTDKLHRVP